MPSFTPLSRREFLRRAGLTTTLALAPAIAAAQEPETTVRHPAEVERFLKSLYAEGRQQYTFRPDYPGGYEALATGRPAGSTPADGLGRHRETDCGPSAGGRIGRPRRPRRLHTASSHDRKRAERADSVLGAAPKGQGKFPLAVLPHGHDRRGHDTYAGVYANETQRAKALAEDRDVAVQAVKRGFLAIAPAVRGLADAAQAAPDVFGRHGDRDCRSHFIHCILAGRTAIGERVWDTSRLIDWAAKLPEVDASNVLMMGNSGGGVVTMYAAAADERITIAVPSCSFSVIASRVGRIYHCDCCAIPGILQWGELYDVCGLAAPRFLLAVNGVKDKLHTAEDINRSAQRVKAIYQAAGAAGHFEHRWGQEGHRFYKDLMWPFVSRALES